MKPGLQLNALSLVGKRLLMQNSPFQVQPLASLTNQHWWQVCYFWCHPFDQKNWRPWADIWLTVTLFMKPWTADWDTPTDPTAKASLWRASWLQPSQSYVLKKQEYSSEQTAVLMNSTGYSASALAHTLQHLMTNVCEEKLNSAKVPRM